MHSGSGSGCYVFKNTLLEVKPSLGNKYSMKTKLVLVARDQHREPMRIYAELD
jgi:hypothetical protein